MICISCICLISESKHDNEWKFLNIDLRNGSTVLKYCHVTLWIIFCSSGNDSLGFRHPLDRVHDDNCLCYMPRHLRQHLHTQYIVSNKSIRILGLYILNGQFSRQSAKN